MIKIIKSKALVLLVLISAGFISTASYSLRKKSTTEDYGTIPLQDALTQSIKRGAEIYSEYCIQCHLAEGQGVKGTFPPLAKSDWLTPVRRKEAIRVVKYGQNGEITVNGDTYNGVMANLGLYDDEVADVMNYIYNHWGNKSDAMVTEEEVKEIIKE